jgi:hypothetical protein
MNSFLPKDYKSPNASDNYMKLEDGENKIRILSSPIMGWEDWLDNKPVRYQMDSKPNSPASPDKPIRHFWSMIVWNYATESIQVLNIVQAKVRKGIESLCADPDWGSPFNYDVKIVRSGDGKLTTYSVIPCPKKDISPYLIEQFHAKPCNLEALFSNGDPFATWTKYTPGFFDLQEVKIAAAETPSVIGINEANVLLALLMKTEDADKNRSAILSKIGITELKDIPVVKYDALKTWVMKQIPVDDELPF